MESIVISALQSLKGKKAEMIFGEKSIKLLGAFVAGLEYVETESWTNIPEYYFRTSFNKWVAERYNILSSLGWEEIVLMQADNDHEKAYHLFYTLFDEYIKEIDI